MHAPQGSAGAGLELWAARRAGRIVPRHIGRANIVRSRGDQLILVGEIDAIQGEVPEKLVVESNSCLENRLLISLDDLASLYSEV